MKKILAFLLTAVMLCALPLTVSAETLNGTKIRSSAADPWLCTDGEYYYLTVTGSTKIAVFRSKTLNGFAGQSINSNIAYDSAGDPTVSDIFGVGSKLSGTWSPEIHYFSEEEAPGNSGWYMFLALRNDTGDSSEVQMVVLKSTSGTPKGPYGHPITGQRNYSQPILNADGTRYTDWAVGMSTLTVAEGEYKGIYTTWVTEEGRGNSGTSGQFFQKLMIAKMINPWTIGSKPGVITTPTQTWEYAGSSATHPRVVEGATAVYGIHGEIYITYSGSGYWSDYGLGQLTWTGGDPLETSSWVKLPNKPTNGAKSYNPIFQAKTALNLRGAGHASFITDKDGNGYLCYHAYAYTGGKKAAGRDAYIEPYYIDYTEWNGTSYGVIHMGLTDTRMPASTSSTVTFASEGTNLGVPTITAKGGSGVTLQMSAENATGYTLYRSTDGTTFTYLTSVDGTSYADSTAEEGKTYYYRAYAYREEELSVPSEVVSAVASAAAASAGVELKMTLGKTAYTLNGEQKTMDVAPIIRNERTMLPVRYVAEALGATIGWDGATSTATLTTADTEIKITVGAKDAIVNGKSVALDSPAFIENDRTYMPVRFVAETLGGTVAWDGATSTATITK
ncbi:MAG: family 43 glycosylhydrolase [Clostridia bacterium]|nr:family 43 glycosylhydrolase [Clostridia bacterium]